MSKQRRLGRGIDALLQGRDVTQLENDTAAVMTIPLARLYPNPDQPRKTFDEEALGELARSIEERGIIQPILAEADEQDRYMIIAGERRWRAAKLAGLTVVPVLSGTFSAEEKLEIALIENIQRQDLSPLEEARAYQDLLENIGLSQDELARRLGKSRPAIANSLRLLKLPETIQEQVNRGEITAGHARTFLGLSGEAQASMEAVANLTIEEDLSVRAVERLVTMLNRGTALEEARGLLFVASDATPSLTPELGDTGPHLDMPGNHAGDLDDRDAEDHTVTDSKGGTGRGTGTGDDSRTGGHGTTRKTVEMEQIEQRMIEALGTRVVISGTDRKGRIEISYLSMEDLERVAEIIIGKENLST